MNPILPSQYYIPDVEARKDEDGNIYLYGSKDCCGNGILVIIGLTIKSENITIVK